MAKILEARVAQLEANMVFVGAGLREVKHEIRQLRAEAHGDFRILCAVSIGTTLGLAGLLAKGFGWV